MNKHLAVLVFSAVSLATAQAQPSPAKAEVVVRTTKALHYRPGGTSKIGFQGTSLMQRGTGEAKVEAKKSNIQSYLFSVVGVIAMFVGNARSAPPGIGAGSEAVAAVAAGRVAGD